MRRLTWIVLASWMLAAHASADQIYLASGSVIEGKATRVGDKVVVEIDSGEVTLPADSVVRIESSASELERIDDLEAKIKPDDATGFLKLANYCRDHEMPAREQELLQHILEIAPDHPEARERLGYVRVNGTWKKREDELRAQGLVLYEGRWVTRAEMLELERMQAQTETAEIERDRAQAEARRAAADAKRAQEQAALAEAIAQQRQAARSYSSYGGQYTYSSPYTYASPYRYSYAPGPSYGYGGCSSGRGPCASPPAYRSSFPIAGVRDPMDSSFSIPGVRDPMDYFRRPR